MSPTADVRVAEEQASSPATRPATREPRPVPTVGRAVRLHLRRDAMGVSGPSPLPLDAATPPGRGVQLEGVIDAISGDGVTLRAGDRTFWFPMNVVLAVEFVDAR